jgi:hypothetical protein
MNPIEEEKSLGVRQFRRGGRVIRVALFRNRGGSVAGRLLLGQNDTPILDGPTPEAVMELARDVWDALELVRAPAA